MYLERKLNLDFVVDKFWMSKRDCNSKQLRYEILPDGCSDIVLELSESGNNAFIYGTTTYNKKISLKPNTDYLGFKLKPGTEILSKRFNTRDLINDVIELERGEFHFSSNYFFDSLIKIPSFDNKINFIKEILQEHNSFSINERMAAILDYIHLKRGSVSTKELAKKHNLSERQIERTFKDKNGITPKLYSRIIRFQGAMQAIESGRNLNMADIAFNLGYSDQAHMTREFRSLSGKTPTDSFFSQ